MLLLINRINFDMKTNRSVSWTYDVINQSIKNQWQLFISKIFHQGKYLCIDRWNKINIESGDFQTIATKRCVSKIDELLEKLFIAMIYNTQKRKIVLGKALYIRDELLFLYILACQWILHEFAGFPKHSKAIELTRIPLWWTKWVLFIYESDYKCGLFANKIHRMVFLM